MYWENNEIYNSFSVSIKKKVIKMDKDNKKSIETKSYIINIIDSIRFISTSLTHHVDNLSEIYKEKFIDKNCKSECEFKRVKNKNFFMIVKIVEKNS